MKNLLWLGFLFLLNARCVTVFAQSSTSQDSSTPPTGQSSSQVQTKKKSFRDRLGFTYWSMFTGPGLGQSLDSTVDATGTPVTGGSNYFQMLIGTYEVSPRVRVGFQGRVFSEFRQDQFQLLNPRLLAQIKDVINTDWLNLGLQPMLEIPTTALTRGRTLQAGLLFAQNWTIKVRDPKWMLFMMSMINANFYRNDTGFRTSEYILIPMLGYQIHKDVQLLTWGWFDWTHVGGTGEMAMSDWGDNYVRFGVNYSLLSNFQIYPCVQVFTNNPTLQNSTLGLELTATL